MLNYRLFFMQPRRANLLIGIDHSTHCTGFFIDFIFFRPPKDSARPCLQPSNRLTFMPYKGFSDRFLKQRLSRTGSLTDNLTGPATPDGLRKTKGAARVSPWRLQKTNSQLPAVTSSTKKCARPKPGAQGFATRALNYMAALKMPMT